jgi:hypothetical protein
MCTVTYIPKDEGFIITSTRDETPTRISEPPAAYSTEFGDIFFPKEPLSGGTWIAANSKNVLCLLNGAYTKHKHEPPYKLSRGLMLLKAFGYKDEFEFAAQFDFWGIEPFTLIWTRQGTLSEMRWDGKVLHHLPLGTASEYLWASCTLYEPEIVSLRKEWFENFLSEVSDPQMEDMLNFHSTPKLSDPQNDILMRRDKVRSISITSIEWKKNGLNCMHKNLESGHLDTKHWEFG